MSSEPQVTVVKRGVNSKGLFDNINSFVVDGIRDIGIVWSNESHREALVEIIGEHLDSLVAEGKIDNWNVISDSRNNKLVDMDSGLYVLDIMYQQHNCLNTTKITYTIQDSLLHSLQQLLDFP